MYLTLQEQVFKDFEDVTADRVLQDSSRKFHHHLPDKGLRDVLHEEVVSMAARKVNVEVERQRAGHEDFVLIQLWHMDVQYCAKGMQVIIVEYRKIVIYWQYLRLINVKRHIEQYVVTAIVLFLGKISGEIIYT